MCKDSPRQAGLQKNSSEDMLLSSRKNSTICIIAIGNNRSMLLQVDGNASSYKSHVWVWKRFNSWSIITRTWYDRTCLFLWSTIKSEKFWVLYFLACSLAINRIFSSSLCENHANVNMNVYRTMIQKKTLLKNKNINKLKWKEEDKELPYLRGLEAVRVSKRSPIWAPIFERQRLTWRGVGV